MIGSGEGEGLGLTEGLGLGDAGAVTVKLTSQTFSGSVCCTVGRAGEAFGLGEAKGVVVEGFFSCKNRIIAVISKISVKLINPHISHLLFFIVLASK